MALTLFSPTQLDAIVSTTLINVPKDHKIAVVGSVDAKGIPVVINFTSADGRWTARAAYRHDWDGNNSLGATLMFSM